MAPPRRKAPKQAAPQTLDQAIALIGEYRDLNAAIEELHLDASTAIAKIEAARDGFAKPFEVRAVEIFRQLRAWWAVAAPEMTEGKRKSIALAGCTIGERTAPPALQLPKGRKAEEIVNVLLDKLAGEYIVTRHKLDKPAIIKALRIDVTAMDPVEDALFLHERNVLTDDAGLTVKQAEEFFVDWPKPAAVETVSDPAEVAS